MDTEKNNTPNPSAAKQEWERILEEALGQAVDLSPKPTRQSDPAPWNLEEFLAADWAEPGSGDGTPKEKQPAPVEDARTEMPEQTSKPAPATEVPLTEAPSVPRRSAPVQKKKAPGSPRTKGKKRPGKPDVFQKFRKNRFWLLGFLWITLVFSDILIRAVVGDGNFWKPGTVLFPLFAIAPALTLFAFTTLFKNKKVNRAIITVFSVVVYLFYASQLVYCKVFSEYYSTNAMLNADQGFGFMGTILVTIWKNLIPLLLLALPLLFVLILGKRFFSFKGGAGWFRTIVAVMLAVVMHFLVVLILPLWGKDTMTPYDVYHYTYGVKETAAQLGLGAAFGRDINWSVFGPKSHGIDFGGAGDYTPPVHAGNSGTQTPDTTDPTGTVNPSDPSVPTAPREYGYNVTALDFEALAAAEGDSDVRDMHLYFNSIQPTKQNEKTGMFEGCNLIILTCEALSHLAIDPELTPTLYKMQTEGFNFTNFYTPIWLGSTTTGEYVALTGTLPAAGDAWCFQTSIGNHMPLTMCAQLKNLGYSAYAYHNHDYDYYYRDESHPNLGYIYKGMGNGLEEGVQQQWPESDLEMIDFTTVDYINQEPFHAYYMTVSGHREYNFMGNNMAKKNKAAVENLPYSDAVKAYLATQIELDKAMELLLQRLEEAGVAENTVIVLTADHYPYGLTNEEISELSGHTVEENFELYRNACIIYKKGMTPETVDWPCASVDVLPTLCNLFGLEYDSRLYMGHDVFSDATPLIIFQNRSWITDQGAYNAATGECLTPDGQVVDKEYERYIDRIVANKFSVSTRILEMDYWDILFNRE